MSTYINGLKNRAVLDNLENLITTQFINLFTKYDDNFSQETKLQAAQQLQEEILRTLTKIRECKDIESIKQLIDQDTTFDYAMIMFERYLMAESMNRQSSPDLMEFITDKNIIQIKLTKNSLKN